MCLTIEYTPHRESVSCNILSAFVATLGEEREKGLNFAHILDTHVAKIAKTSRQKPTEACSIVFGSFTDRHFPARLRISTSVFRWLRRVNASFLQYAYPVQGTQCINACTVFVKSIRVFKRGFRE